MSSTPYAELHCHTNFSFLDGASAADDLVERAIELGLSGLAVTDHGGLYGAVRFVTAAQAAGLHPVVGIEIELVDPAVPDAFGIVVPARRPTRRGPGSGRLAGQLTGRPPDRLAGLVGDVGEGLPARPRPVRARLPGHRAVVREDLRGIGDRQRGPHLVLLARDATGYRSLCRLVSRANLAGTKGVPQFTQALLAEHSEGLVALSGCREGEVARRLRVGDREGARAVAERYGRLFGAPGAATPGAGARSGVGAGAGGAFGVGAVGAAAGARTFGAVGAVAGAGFVLELGHHLLPDDDWLLAETVRLADEVGLPVVVTNDVHYARPEDREMQDVLTAIRHGRTLETLADLRRPDGESYLKSGTELAALVTGPTVDERTAHAWTEGLSNAGELAAGCSVDLGFERYRFPGFDVPKGETAFSHLEQLCHDGARRRYHPMTPAVVRQLAHELEVIERTGLAEFFLICWDLMRFAKGRGIPAQGRGSAADSIVAYVLGITRVDPIRHRLLFERFINEGRTTYPDVDIDFSSERREEVIQYVYSTYGPEHTGMVCNVVTYRARSAVREVGYALGFPRPLVDRVAKALETYDSVMVRRDLETEGGFGQFFARPGEPGVGSVGSVGSAGMVAGAGVAGAGAGVAGAASEAAGEAAGAVARAGVAEVGAVTGVGMAEVTAAADLAGKRGLVDGMGQLNHARGGRWRGPLPVAVAREGLPGSHPDFHEPPPAFERAHDGFEPAPGAFERGHDGFEPAPGAFAPTFERGRAQDEPIAGAFVGSHALDPASIPSDSTTHATGGGRAGSGVAEGGGAGPGVAEGGGAGSGVAERSGLVSARISLPSLAGAQGTGPGPDEVSPDGAILLGGARDPDVERDLASSGGRPLPSAAAGDGECPGSVPGNDASDIDDDTPGDEPRLDDTPGESRLGAPYGDEPHGRLTWGSRPAIRAGGPSDDEGGPGDSPASVRWLREGRDGYEPRDRRDRRQDDGQLDRRDRRQDDVRHDRPDRHDPRDGRDPRGPRDVPGGRTDLFRDEPVRIGGRTLDPDTGVLLPPERSTDRLGRPNHWDPAPLRSAPARSAPPRSAPARSAPARASVHPPTTPPPTTPPPVTSAPAPLRSSVARLEPEPPPMPSRGSTRGLSDWERWLEFCARIDGFPRHLSIHSGGMLVTAAPLIDIAPLERATMPGRVVVQYDKRDVETLKLIKLDLLGLGMLAAIDETLRLIEADCATCVDLDRLPEDIPEVFEMLQAADTVGVFQVESRAQMQTLPKSRPANLDDLVVEVAIIRPGPIQGNAVHPYLRRKQGIEPVEYLHPSLAPILADSLGVILYQEQVMQIAIGVAGFSAGDSDGFRRAMGTWRSTREMEKLHARFVDGCRTVSGLTDDQSEELFRQVAAFASFGFAKSHAAAFARTAYESAFLKLFYPAQFLVGLVNAQPMGFYPVEVLVNDAKRHGVTVLPVDINASAYRTTTEWVGVDGPLPPGAGVEARPRPVRSPACVVPDAAARARWAAESATAQGVRLGLRLVNGIGEEHAARLDAELATGPYRSLADVVARTGLSEEVIERLIRAGGLDSLGRPRRELLWQLREVAGATKGRAGGRPAGAVRASKRAAGRPMDLRLPATPAPELPPLGEVERLGDAYAVLSLDAQRQVVGLFREALGRLGAVPNSALAELRPGRVRIGGLVVTRQHPMTAKGTVFLALEDETGMVNVTLWPDAWARLRGVVRRHALLLVDGTLQREGNVVNVIARDVRPLPEATEAVGGPTRPAGVRQLGMAGMRRA